MNWLVSRRHFLIAGSSALLATPFAFRRAVAEESTTKTQALVEFGEPLYAGGFDHWPYANPDAPKGGRIVLADTSGDSFDSLNMYPLQGEVPQSIGLIYDTLMIGSGDELSSAYPLIAEQAEYPEDKSWIAFDLRTGPRYDDGVPITAADFKFAFDTIKQHGRPFLRSFYEDVEACEAESDSRVKFTFKTRNNMKPLLVVAQMEPAPRHYWASRDISKPTLEPPLGSSSYKISAVAPGRSITYARVKDYWGEDLPVNRGTGNFDEIHYDFYRDDTVEFEAFKSGRIDYRGETSAQRWVTGYDLPQVREGKIVKREVPNETPRGMGSFFFNVRRPQLQDIRVRRAIVRLYDFETTQRTLLFGKYKRIKTYFPNSDFGAEGPPKPEEIAVLEPFKDKLAPEVTTQAYELPVSDGSGNNRESLRMALALFKEAGWDLQGGKLIKRGTAEQLALEIMTADPQAERLSGPFVQNLRRAGINASIRFIDSAQWTNRIDDLDFDVWTGRLNFFPPPGPELRSYFGSQAADQRGSANSTGIKDPVIDALIEQIIAAKDLETLKVTTRALDRVLLWGEYAIPTFYNDQFWIAYWNKFGYPERKPKYSVGFPGTWWMTERAVGEVAPQ
jgi:microcin C transport system substrate-binding protein